MKLQPLAIIALILFAFNAYAHDGLHEQIVAVTAEIKKSPEDPGLFLKRAELYRLHKDWRSSERDLNKASKLDPKLTIIDLKRGKLFFDRQMFRRARIVLERYTAAEPGAFEGALMLGRTLAKLGDESAAARSFTRAIDLAPLDSVEIYVERATALAAAGKIEDALNGLDAGLLKLGPLVTLQTLAIELEVDRRNYDAALQRLDVVAAQMPRKESFELQRGEILLKANRACEARTSFLKAKEGFEKNSTFRRNVPAVKAQISRLERHLAQTSTMNCN